MKYLSKKIVDVFFDAGLPRAFYAFGAVLGVVTSVVVTVVATLVAGIFSELDWFGAAYLWSWPAFSWIPALPIVITFAASFVAFKGEDPVRRTVDIGLATFALLVEAALVQGVSATLNVMASTDPTAGLPMPGFIPWVIGAGVLGYAIGTSWDYFVDRRCVYGAPKRK